MNNIRRTRGALRHWIIGCGIVLIIIVAIIGAAGYFGFRELKKHADFGILDTARLADPPLDASAEVLFPATAGPYQRMELKTVQNIDPPYKNTTTQTISIETDSSTGIIHARYAHPDADIYAYALNAAQASEMEENPEHRDLIRRGRGGNKTGYHLSIKSGNTPFSMATWSKPNWTYLVQTTSTQAMDFVENFNPGPPAN